MKPTTQQIIVGSTVTLLIAIIIACVIYYFFLLKPGPVLLHQPEFQVSEEIRKEINDTVAQIEVLEIAQEKTVVDQEKQLQQNRQATKTINTKQFTQEQRRAEQMQQASIRQEAELPGGRFDFNPN
jgi:cell division protein FtsN